MPSPNWTIHSATVSATDDDQLAHSRLAVIAVFSISQMVLRRKIVAADTALLQNGIQPPCLGAL